MKKKTINIITNILGILSWIAAIALPFTEFFSNIWQIVALAVIGFAALKFKNETIEKLIDKLLSIKQ